MRLFCRRSWSQCEDLTPDLPAHLTQRCQLTQGHRGDHWATYTMPNPDPYTYPDYPRVIGQSVQWRAS